MNNKPVLSSSVNQPNTPANVVVWLSLLLITACSSTPERPAWLDSAESSYPAVTHLTATGSADDRQTAADRAISNLAKIFEVNVQESSTDFSSAQVNAVQGQQQITNEQKITRAVSTETRQVLQGAQVVEYWQNEQGQVHALAVLAKQPAANRFRQAILAADGEIKDLIGYASTTASNPLSALGALKRARSAQIQRDQLNQRLMIVADGRGIKSQHDQASMDSLIRDALGTLPIAVEAEDPSVKAELQRALTKLGVKTVAQSDYVLRGAADLVPVSKQQGLFWLRGSYELMLQHNDTVLGKQRWPVKVSATNQDLVQQRARDQLNQKLPGYLFDLLSSETE
ncbi:LPP20 family lipoprotein [Allohahella sp. A8]|uniref:LPP20 family lipoprotein n=1 Tax=Allohahella sp. A8 TaxID=3141461 RepID=UPI003A80F2C9